MRTKQKENTLDSSVITSQHNCGVCKNSKFFIYHVLLYQIGPLVLMDKRMLITMAMRFDEVTWMQAEILWANCGAELVYSIQDFQNLQYCDDDKTLIGKQRILKAIHVQDPHVKKTILDCLRVKRIVLSDVRKNKPTRKWYVEYLVSFLHKPNDGPTRRKLAEGSVSNEMVVVVVIVTAVVTLCLAGLLFYCYIRKCVVSGDQNDEKPLLSFSFGNSKKTSNTKGKNGNTENESTQVSVDSGLEMKALDPSMQPPGGRVKESMRHTLKPRAVRAESSLRPTRMMDFSQRHTGNTESPVVATELSPKPSPIEVESSSRKPHVNISSPVSSPAVNTQPPSKYPQSSPEPPTLPTGAAPPAPTGGTPSPPPSAGGATPPPPPTVGVPPPPPKLGGNGGGPPPPPRRLGASKVHRRGDQADVSKAKLKPFFWDKVMAKPDQQMVWDKIKSGSFQ